MAPWARRLGVFLACYANRTREVKRDFCDLRIRRGEGACCEHTLVVKKGSLEKEKGEKKDKKVRERRTDGRRRRRKRERGDGKRLKESRGERE
ncbi:hypothetical protein TNCV_1796081 [Trichonephila clavipes]|nr:hypothetical protein TNCV_1796081 [Trichonephila clavipes]